MNQLATLAEQQQHYSAVRARLRGTFPVARVRVAPVALPQPQDPLPIEKPNKSVRRGYAGEPKAGWGGTWRRAEADAIIAETAEKHGISIGELIGRGRKEHVMRARWETYYRIQQELDYSLSMIGVAVGGKEHTGVLHGIRKHVARMAGAE